MWCPVKNGRAPVRHWHLPGLIAALVALLAGSGVGLATVATNANAAPGDGPRVTVSQSTDLVNQRVKVTWAGFRENSYSLDIVQCRGTAPQPHDCYGVNRQEGDPGKQGIPNNSNGIGGMTGSAGSVWFEVRPKSELPDLACDDKIVCSVGVIMRPADTATKDNYFLDARTRPGNVSVTERLFRLSTEVGQVAFAPIKFAPEGDSCPDRGVSLHLAGNAEHSTAGLSWLGALCRRPTDAMTMTVSSGSGPEGRASFLAGTVDGAIVSQPINGPLDRTLVRDGSPPRDPAKVTYAPLTNSSIAIVFNMDDTATKQPITSMRLTPRLVAKLLTHAYFGDPTNGVPSTGKALNTDPEFLALNPGHAWPDMDRSAILRGIADDSVWELSRWLLSDPETRAWLQGGAEPSGILCPVNWRVGKLDYPFGTILSRTPGFELNYRPVSSYSELVKRLVNAAQPQLKSDEPKDIDPDVIGARRVIGITGGEAAARFNLPTAELRNPAGQFVAPTTESVAAGVNAALPGPDGVTLSNNFANRDPKAYPLTKTDVAVFPTKDVGKPLAESIDTYLEYVAGPGQKSGPFLGELPAGYAPLTAKQKQQVEAARTAVRQAAQQPPPTTPPSTTTGGNGTSGGTDGGGTGGTTGGDTSGGSTTGGGGDSAGATTGGTGGTGGASTPPAGKAPPSPSASPKSAPVASTGDNKVQLPSALADRVRQALRGDPASILIVVLICVAVGSAAASPVLLGYGWRRRTGRWPPPVAAVIRAWHAVLRRPTGAS